jgi:hypothetical protein
VAAFFFAALVWLTTMSAANRGLAQEQRAVAEANAAQAAKARQDGTDDSIEANNAATKQKLAERLEASFDSTSLGDVLDYLAAHFDLELLCQRGDMEAGGLSLDAPVTLKLKRVRGDMLLHLALRQVSPDLGYVVRDGIIVVSTRQALADGQTVRVYNCRDLLAAAETLPPPAGAGEPGSAGGPPPGAAGPRPAGGGPRPPGTPFSVGSGGMGGFIGGGPATKAEQLQHVIRTTIAPESWDIGGGSGTMEEFGGLLVVNQSEAIHDRIEKLLQMLREAAGKK